MSSFCCCSFLFVEPMKRLFFFFFLKVAFSHPLTGADTDQDSSYVYVSMSQPNCFWIGCLLFVLLQNNSVVSLFFY